MSSPGELAYGESVTYSEILRKYMALRGVGAIRLCRMAGLDPAARQKTISRLRDGSQRTIDANEWRAICRALDVDPANGADLKARGGGPTVEAAPSSPEGYRMVRDETGEWVRFTLSEDAARYDDGTCLELRESNGVITKVEVVTIRGRKWVLPVPESK